jgi:hypothetical protein
MGKRFNSLGRRRRIEHDLDQSEKRVVLDNEF